MSIDAIRQTIQNIGIRTRSENIHLITSQGFEYEWMFDLRRVFLRTDTLEQIADAFWERYATREPFQLAGIETAGIPLLAALMLRAPKHRGTVNGFIVRKNRKTTGLGNAIEGDVLDLPVVLVDDALNSGRSADKARATVAATGCAIKDMFVVVDFCSRRGRQWRSRRAIEVCALFDLSDFGLTFDHPPDTLVQDYAELWRTITPGAFAFHVVPKSAPLLVGDRIYRGSDSAKMQAFSAETGGLIWEYQTTGGVDRKGIWSSPAVHDGRLYFGAYNGTIYCLDAETGREIWVKPIGEWVGASPLIVPRHNLVYFGIEYARPWAKGSIGAYDLTTGELVWEHVVGKLQHGSPGYWAAGDLVIWGSADHETLALEAATGKLIWSFKTRRSVKYAPAVDESRGMVAFASFDKSIYLLDVATGNKLGEWETGEICYTTPLFADSKLFCGSGDRHLYVIDLDTLQMVKKIDLHARVYSSPKRIGDRVILGTSGGRVMEFDIESLQPRGILQLPDAVTNAVCVSDNLKKIYISTYMNHLYAFERIDGNERVDRLMNDRVDTEIADVPGARPSRQKTLLNFERIAEGVDIAAMRAEVTRCPALWSLNTARQEKIVVQRETESIFLRSADRSRQIDEKIEDLHPSVATDVARKFPIAVGWAETFARRCGKRLGRMLLAKLRANGQVYRHIDGGEYYRVRDRYHLVLVSESGSPMNCGDETVVMREGELWWFDNKQPHEAFNRSEHDRIHLIFDLEAITPERKISDQDRAGAHESVQHA